MTARKPKPAITEQQPRFCRQCGKPLERHKGERPSAFAKRRLCGIKCRKLADGLRMRSWTTRTQAGPLDDIDPDLRPGYEP